MATYSEKLKYQRWQDLRLRVLEEYDNRCSGCGGSNELNVHHLKYKEGHEPWEYNTCDLTVLCKSCHDVFHDNKKRFDQVCTNGRLFYSYEFEKIIQIIDVMARVDTSNYDSILEFAKSKDNSF